LGGPAVRAACGGRLEPDLLAGQRGAAEVPCRSTRAQMVEPNASYGGLIRDIAMTYSGVLVQLMHLDDSKPLL
jgi:hypothetical protein